jgi:hypothetical protein
MPDGESLRKAGRSWILGIERLRASKREAIVGGLETEALPAMATSRKSGVQRTSR